MQDLECTAKWIESDAILCIAFTGFYPPGSQGNPLASEMSAYVSKSINEFQPSSVLFNFSGLHYRWGDAIFSVVAALLREGWRPPLSSVCVVAEGETAQSIRPLFEPNWGFGCMGVKLFTDKQSAMAYLKIPKETAELKYQ